LSAGADENSRAIGSAIFLHRKLDAAAEIAAHRQSELAAEMAAALS